MDSEPNSIARMIWLLQRQCQCSRRLPDPIPDVLSTYRCECGRRYIRKHYWQPHGVMGVGWARLRWWQRG